jgi:hypothetical protein
MSHAQVAMALLLFIRPFPAWTLCVSWMGFLPGRRRTGNQHSQYDMKKNTSRATGKAAVEGSEHEY